jgi:uncharacterized protein (DUF1697 family)
MSKYIILLRGVMPVGKNKVSMSELRSVLSKENFENVRTYIASGNIVADTDLSAEATEIKVRTLIKKHLGPDLTVVARTGAQLQNMLDANPFGSNYDISRVFFVSFAVPPHASKIKELLRQDFSPEKLVITNQGAYMYIPGNAARSKLSNNFLEKKFGVSATTRNANTMNRLIEMSRDGSI